MTSPQASSASPPTDSPPIVSPTPTPGLDSLARRITRRTTDLIVIGIVIVAGLTVAQRLVVWWQTDPADAQADPEFAFSRAALAPWGAGAEGVAVDLADQPLTLWRQTFLGSREEALSQLRSACRETLAAADLTLPEPADRETKLLAVLQQHPATESADDGRWGIYEVPTPLSMTLAVRRGVAPGEVDRVICWGLVLPLSEEAWSILRISPRSAHRAGRVSDPIPLPPGADPGLAVRDELGGQLVTFTGAGPIDRWQAHFNQLAKDRRWAPATAWHIAPGMATATWTSSGDADSRIDLRITHSDAGWTGVINISPTRQKDHP